METWQNSACLRVLATYRRDGTVLGEAVQRIASRYLGRQAGAAYADRADDDLLIRLEPGDLRAWDFAGELS